MSAFKFIWIFVIVIMIVKLTLPSRKTRKPRSRSPLARSRKSSSTSCGSDTSCDEGLEVSFRFDGEECLFGVQPLDLTHVVPGLSSFQWVLDKWLSLLWTKIDDGTGYAVECISDQYQKVAIHDARKSLNLSFEKNGFTLITLQEPTKTTNWYRYSWNMHIFEKEMSKHIMQLFPNATRILYGNHNIRGGEEVLHIPKIIDYPHLDYSQNDSLREDFFKHFAVSETLGKGLLGQLDSKTDEIKVVLGIWKPIMMSTPVCDYPLAVADANTFMFQYEQPMLVHIKVGPYVYHNAGGRSSVNPDQKWYYYSQQTTDEVLIFTQYTKGTEHANFHTGFSNPNSCEGFDERYSFEMRAAVFFPKTH